MPTFLSRPVFDFPVNWATTPRQSFSYELRDRVLGMSAPVYEPLQLAPVRGFEFALDLRSEDEIVALDNFFSALKGRLNGFWIASPFLALEITPGLASNFTFLIKDQNLRDVWTDHPDVYLEFRKPGQVTQYGKLGSIEVTLDGQELITLDADLASAVDDSWTVRQLVYVRLVEDGEKARYWADNRAQRKVRVIELPAEYAALETGQQPVFLYRFSLAAGGSTQTWTMTSLNEDIVSDMGGAITSSTFTSRPITHGAHRQSMKNVDDGLELTSWREPWNPLAQFLPFTLPGHLWVAVFETTYAAPNVGQIIFQGRVKSVKPQGKLLTARCQAFGGIFEKKFPRFLLQPRCNYPVFSAPCGLVESRWRINGQITSVVGRKVVLTVSAPPLAGETASGTFGYWALGWLSVGSGATYQRVAVTQSAALTGTSLELRTKTPLLNPDALVGAIATLAPGCDGADATCRDKFYNFQRWGGHVQAPQNPSVRAAAQPAVNGNKK